MFPLRKHQVVLVQAPLEFSNPVTCSHSMPNGRTVFLPKPGDFLLFPSYLPHTVPMRHAASTKPRLSIAFNIYFVGKALERCVAELKRLCGEVHVHMPALK